MKTYAYVQVVLATLVVIGCSQNEQTRGNPPDQAVLIGATDMEREVLGRFRGYLAELATKSALADSLLQFYDANRVYARDMGGGAFMVLEEPRASQFFYVYVGSGGDLSMAPGDVVVVASFNADVRAIELRYGTFSPLVMGLMLAHELVHAQDFVTGREGITEMFSPEWLAGEQRAHYTTYQILKEYTDGRWRQLAQESRQERVRLVGEQGYEPRVFTMGAVPGDSARVASILPNASFSDLSVLATWMIYDANILNIQEIAGQNDTIRTNGVMMFTVEFYRKFASLNFDSIIAN